MPTVPTGLSREPAAGGAHRADARRPAPPGSVAAWVLGPVRLCRNGEWVNTGGTKQRTVLAAILLAQGAGLSESRLERLLWGDDPPDSARAQIQTYIYKLRKLMGPAVVVARQGSGYALTEGPAEFDLTRFERQADRGRQALGAGRHQEAADELRAALSLWRGPALADVTEHLKRVKQPRLEELRLAALEDRVEADLALVHEGELVPELTGLVAEYPRRERLRGQLMRALHRAGRRADALAVYRSGRRLLLEETGLEPGERLRHIHDAILSERSWTQVPAQPAPVEAANPVAGPATAEPADAGRPAQLPPVGLELVGRHREVAAVLSRFTADTASTRTRTAPICLISGMAGVGKTVLAVHVAQRRREAYPDGQLYADLRGLDERPADPAEVLARFLQALGVEGGAGSSLEERVALYRSRVADRRVFVVLDDAASAAQVRPLLPSGVGCGALVTSRSRLSGVEGAATVDLGVFALGEATQLLGRLAGEDRVAAEPRSADSIGRLCGGLPLAVGIAGARLAARPHWPLSRLARRLGEERRLLDELSHDDMDVRATLTRGAQDLPDPALHAWRLVACLDVPWFAPWTVGALLGVPVETAEELVDALVDARLLEVAPDGDGRYVGYRFHSLIRAVAREHAVKHETPVLQRAALGRAFGAWLALAREAERALLGADAAGLGCGRSRRLPEDDVVRDLLADPVAWFRFEKPVLLAAVAQTRAESRRVLASELAQVLGRLEHAVGSAAGARPDPLHAGVGGPLGMARRRATG